MISINKTFNYIIFFYILLASSLLVGFYFNEDASGGGAVVDFNATWKFNLALKENLYIALINSREWSDHFPLHHFITSLILFFTEKKDNVRLIFCLLYLSIPYLFYLNLKIKFPNISKNNILLLSSLIFLLPAFRYSAIWANDHNTSSIFFLLSTLFFLKWEKAKKYNKLNLNILLSTIFLALAVYCRQYYSIIFLYFMLIFFQKMNLKNFIKISLFVFLMSLPGFWLILHQSSLLVSIYTTSYQNSILVTSSILSFYLAPIFLLVAFSNKPKFLDMIKKKKINFYFITIFSILFVFTLTLFNFDYNYKIGGGFFFKLSILFFNNYFLLYCTSVLGIILIIYLSIESKNSLFLFLLFMFALSGYYIFQKYYEPTFLFIFFLLLNSKVPQLFLEKSKNLLYLYIYIFVYLSSAIINDIVKITHNL